MRDNIDGWSTRPPGPSLDEAGEGEREDVGEERDMALLLASPEVKTSDGLEGRGKGT